MPQIAELREIDGAIWARIPPFSTDQGCMQILSEAEISERDRKTSALLAEIERLQAALKDLFLLACVSQDILPDAPQMKVAGKLLAAFEQKETGKQEG